MTRLLPTQPDCVADEGSWCERVYRLTETDWLARYANPVIDAGLSILLILLIAVLLRWVVTRTIKRLTRGATEGRVPALLRPLRERAPESWRASRAPVLYERRDQRARTIGSVLRSFASFLIFGVAFTLVLGELGINLGPIIASAGIVGVAVGFGAQNLVRDFLSGIFMMVEDQYGVGDVVDLGEATGEVEAVGLRVTTLRDVNGTVWYVRNGEVLRVGNMSQGHAVAVVDIPVAHSADIPEASDLAARTATELTAEGTALAADVLAPPEMLGIESVTTDAVTLRVTVKTRAGRQWTVQRALRAGIIDAFDDAGVPPPLPLRPAPPPT
ncbi:MAG TPA: mechanosensitive ion channel family protein [Pseudonocardiaceae bacterium]|nr:mechanosensitive ion channel family protein [Pseudonocardiaceae bacterium]